jgi:divalent metal cation (Fe/Co/Zn/Cd) transporter
MKVAKERKSAVLESNAIHHRVDSLTGIAALVSIAVSNVFPTFAAMDAIGGLVISWMVISAGWGNTRNSLNELADASITDEIKSKVRKVTTETLKDSTTADFTVLDVQGTKAGQNYLLEVELLSQDDTIELRELDDVEEKIREAVGKRVRGARRVRIRFVTARQDGFSDEFIHPDVMSSVRSTPEPEEHHHHHHHENGSSKKDN